MSQLTLTDSLIGYRVRTRLEVHEFFRRGRVFAMLWHEPTSETVTGRDSDSLAITVGRYGQGIFAQVRRFVIVDVNRDRHYVYA
jgi:hypothetical protein